MIVQPKYISLDTATLGRLALDSHSDDAQKRRAAKNFIESLAELNYSVVISLTHLCELLRHNDDTIVRQRFKFLSQLPLIAWPRPYNQAWFVGSIADIAAKELAIHQTAQVRGLQAIRDVVLLDLWQTGTGEDMFRDSDDLWGPLIEVARRTLDRDRYVASFAVTDRDGASSLTVAEIRSSTLLSRDEIPDRIRRLANELESLVSRVGDSKLTGIAVRAEHFARETGTRVEHLLETSGDLVSKVCTVFGVPESLIAGHTTVDEIGELAVLAGKMNALALKINLPEPVDLESVPPGSIPTLTFDRALIALQQQAVRVSGSDMGDCHLSALSLYADITEVDRRTYAYLERVRRRHTCLGTLIGPLVKTGNYDQLLAEIKNRM